MKKSDKINNLAKNLENVLIKNNNFKKGQDNNNKDSIKENIVYKSINDNTENNYKNFKINKKKQTMIKFEDN